MNIKELNEEIDRLLEKEVSPEFQQTLDKYRITKENPNIDKVYQYLADRDIDVQNCTIETLDGGTLKSKDLKKLYDSAIAKDPNNGVVLLVPKPQGFVSYLLYTDDGKFIVYHIGGLRQFGIVDGDTAHTFKVGLNSGDYEGTNLFLVYGPSIKQLRKERQLRKHGAINLERKPGDQSYNPSMEDAFHFRASYIDKSGYVVNFEDIMNKLVNYKNKKGAYSEELDKLMNQYSTTVDVAKQFLTEFDPKVNYGRKPETIIKQLSHLGYTMSEIDGDLSSKDAFALPKHIETAYKQLEELNNTISS